MGDRSIANIIRKFATETPDNAAIKFGSRRVSWMSVPAARPGTCRLQAYRASSASLSLEVTAADIIAFGKAYLAGYKCPTSVDFVAALPRNPSAKVLKKDLRVPYWAGKARRIN